MKKQLLRSASGLVFLFLLFSPQFLFAEKEIIDRILVIVDERIITQSALEEAFAPMKERIEASEYSADEKKAIIQRYRSETLKQLIDQTITDIAVEKAEIRVSDQEIEDAVTQTRMNYNLSLEEFEEALAGEGLTLELYKNQIRNQMLRSRLVNYEIRSKIVITDEDVEAFYKAHPERYLMQRRYHLARIFIPYMAEMTEEQQNAQNRKMEQVVIGLQAGEDFALLADRENPPGISGNGGELGWFDEKSLSPAIANALAPLGPGGVSDVLQSSQGLQIFKILEIAPQAQRPLEEVADEISEELYTTEVNSRLEKWLTDLRDKVHIRILDE
ncbi:peptidyl-prolyl cis-trans isomerase [Desulfococcaceae bacterium OttesenSCG-928-F15]|nr:peptidyl-prolyl cis-trans isomerase [Desulfococcaceae bacterium OttesenSCG-928-F15]